MTTNNKLEKLIDLLNDKDIRNLIIDLKDNNLDFIPLFEIARRIRENKK